MWKVGDLVKQRPSIFRVEEVVGVPMEVVRVVYPEGNTSGWPLEVITKYKGRLYRWGPDGLMPYTGHSGDGNSRAVHGGTAWE